MITVNEAQKIITEHTKLFPAVECSLEEAYGAVLREDIFADRDQPAFDKVLMDGIAINFETWKQGRREFKIFGTQAAGTNALKLRDPTHCIEVMTGAILPEGTDCVVPVEQIQVQKSQAKIQDSISLNRMQNILKKGSDYKKGKLLLKSGTHLTPPAVAVAAAVGKKVLKVSSTPKIAIISTGDELVKIGKPVKSFQIRVSNSYALHAALEKNGFCKIQMFHLKDDLQEMLKTINRIVKTFDVLILSGGVSMGKFDYVPQVLTKLGVKVLFHKVRQKPGKPFWFGVKKDGPTVFALPGNPASTLVCFYRYVLPQLKSSSGFAKMPQEFVVLGEDVHVSFLLTNFLPVTLESHKDGQKAKPVSTSGSGDYLALAKSDGFVELKEGRGDFAAKTSVPFYRW